MKAHVSISPRAVGAFLRSLRVNHDPALSSGEAAALVGCNEHNYSNIEAGRRTITPKTLLEYSTKLVGDQDEALARMMAFAANAGVVGSEAARV